MSKTTDHTQDVAWLRNTAAVAESRQNYPIVSLTYLLAADLLELHDDQGISLDNWDAARSLIEMLLDHTITENGV